MSKKEREAAAKEYADTSVPKDVPSPWAEDERNMRWSGLYHTKLGHLELDEAGRMRGEG